MTYSGALIANRHCIPRCLHTSSRGVINCKKTSGYLLLNFSNKRTAVQGRIQRTERMPGVGFGLSLAAAVQGCVRIPDVLEVAGGGGKEARSC